MGPDDGAELSRRNPEMQKVFDLLEMASRDRRDVRVRVGYLGKEGERGTVGGRVDVFNVEESLEKTDKITGVAYYAGREDSVDSTPRWDPKIYLPKAWWFLYPDGQRSEKREVVNSLNREDIMRVRDKAGGMLQKTVDDKLRRIGNREELLRARR